MMQRRFVQFVTAIALTAVPAAASAQSASSAPQPTQSESRSWITAGGGFTALKGDCTTCKGDPVYRRTGSLLVNIGFRGNRHLDGGVELFWAPASTKAGERIRTTFLMGVAQYRPWGERGLFIKGGMGVAFVRNWIYDATNDVTPPFTTNAMSLTYGAGWEFRTRSRVGLQIYGLHHISALGDLTVSNGSTVENVIGNFWTLGASIVIR